MWKTALTEYVLPVDIRHGSQYFFLGNEYNSEFFILLIDWDVLTVLNSSDGYG